MRATLKVCAVLCACAAGQAAMAQANAWNGKWKADMASMKYDGASMTVTGDDKAFTVSGVGPEMKIICDGKPHDAPMGTMIACTKTGATYTMTTTKDGKRTRHTEVSLSADGNMETRKVMVYPTDGTAPYTVTMTLKRVSGGPGVTGVWKETGFHSSTESGLLSIEVSGDMIAFKETDAPKPLNAKLGGPEVKDQDGTAALKLADPHTLKVVYKGSDGKVRRENTFVLSGDGKTVTETDVTPDPGASKMVLVLHKM